MNVVCTPTTLYHLITYIFVPVKEDQRVLLTENRREVETAYFIKNVSMKHR